MNNLLLETLKIGSWVVVTCGSVLVIGLIVWITLWVYTRLFESLITLFRFKKEFTNFLMHKWNTTRTGSHSKMPEAEANELKQKILNHNQEVTPYLKEVNE